MSFNRLKYDSCEIKKYNQESQGPGEYYSNTPIMCNPCFNSNPRIINQKNGASMNNNTPWRFYDGPVDVESQLRNLNMPNSRCPDKKYIPSCYPDLDKKEGYPCGSDSAKGLVNPSNCYFPTEDTRLSNPPATLRGTGWNRFEFLCKNPQEQVTFPGAYLTSTRIVVKDNHRPNVVDPRVNDMNPNEKLAPCPKINSVCGNYTQPLYQYDVCG